MLSSPQQAGVGRPEILAGQRQEKKGLPGRATPRRSAAATAEWEIFRSPGPLPARLDPSL